MSFQSKDDKVLGLQLKVQRVVAKLGDSIVSVSGSTATLALGESIKEVRSALHADDSVGLSMVSAANRSVSGSSVTLTLNAPLAADDALIVDYVLVK